MDYSFSFNTRRFVDFAQQSAHWPTSRDRVKQIRVVGWRQYVAVGFPEAAEPGFAVRQFGIPPVALYIYHSRVDFISDAGALSNHAFWRFYENPVAVFDPMFECRFGMDIHYWPGVLLTRSHPRLPVLRMEHRPEIAACDQYVWVFFRELRRRIRAYRRFLKIWQGVVSELLKHV